MSSSGILEAGVRVRIRTDPGRVGVVTGQTRQRGSEVRLQVQFPDQAQYVPADQLERVAEGGDDPLDLLKRGRLARPVDLRRTLTHARLTGRLANVIYSLDTTGADFYAYQFKPLVKLLNSATTGMLIADEVGLGKTIEAGLIWTELRSRFDYDRLLVLCPAMLREKWRRELRQRFGVEARIVDAAGLVEQLREARAQPDTTRFALIASLQGVRPRRGWDEDEADMAAGGAATRLARFLDEHAEDTPLVDLAIIDEAHYLRNPATMTAAAGRLVRGVAEYVVLLSATPVHLKSEDLYQVLSLADPATFNRPDAFDGLLAANEPLVKARDLVASGRATREELAALLEEAGANPLLAGSRQLEMLAGELPAEGALRDPTVAAPLAARLETVNLLGHVVTRTRKRDVHEWRVQREPVAEAVPLGPEEKEFYDAVTQVVRAYCARMEAHEGFLLVMPQRQMASSMPAAFRSWMDRLDPEEEAAYEDMGLEQAGDDRRDELGPVVGELVRRVGSLSSYERLRASDSKYALLRERLGRLFAERPTEKVVLFSSFRPTLAYLRERLSEDGIESMVLHGGTEDKDAAVQAFRDADCGTVLLSSEVASEGIDLQFAWVLVNYDLPWNPMRVEQRIGRLDRLGQSSPKVAIWNLFYDGTIDARIYRRLYERLQIFEKSLGAIEPILGGEVRELALDLLRQDLTPEQEEARIEQTALALENRRNHEEQLEGEAAHLVAYGDYIVNQIHAARAMSRKIDAQDLCGYVTEFLRGHYPGCELRQVSEALDFEVRLSGEAKHDFEEFLERRKLRGATRLSRVDARAMACRFENSVAGGSSGRVEVLNQLHPLIRFVSHRLEEDPEQNLRPAVAVRLDRAAAPEGAVPGVYAFVAERWTMAGIQQTEHLSYVAASVDGSSELLSPDDAEHLVHAAATYGRDWLSAATEVDLECAFDVADGVCLAGSQSAYKRRVAELRAQNDDRAQIQERTLDRTLEDQRAKLREVLARHRERGRTGLVAATEGRIRALEERVERKRREIKRRRAFDHRSEEICAGLILVEEGTGGAVEQPEESR